MGHPSMLPHGRMTHFMSKLMMLHKRELRLLGEELKSKFSISQQY